MKKGKKKDREKLYWGIGILVIIILIILAANYLPELSQSEEDNLEGELASKRSKDKGGGKGCKSDRDCPINRSRCDLVTGTCEYIT